MLEVILIVVIVLGLVVLGILLPAAAQRPYLAKEIQLFVSMDRMVGGDFEDGLAAMKVAPER